MTATSHSGHQFFIVQNSRTLKNIKSYVQQPKFFKVYVQIHLLQMRMKETCKIKIFCSKINLTLTPRLLTPNN